jgi:hypothetical protein
MILAYILFPPASYLARSRHSSRIEVLSVYTVCCLQVAGWTGSHGNNTQRTVETDWSREIVRVIAYYMYVRVYICISL